MDDRQETHTLLVLICSAFLSQYLQAGETVTVDTRSVVAIEESVELGIVLNGKFCTCFLGGEGCFSTTLTGPGKVFLQSMCFSKFSAAVQQTVMEDRGSGGDINIDLA